MWVVGLGATAFFVRCSTRAATIVQLYRAKTTFIDCYRDVQRWSHCGDPAVALDHWDEVSTRADSSRR